MIHDELEFPVCRVGQYELCDLSLGTPTPNPREEGDGEGAVKSTLPSHLTLPVLDMSAVLRAVYSCVCCPCVTVGCASPYDEAV